METASVDIPLLVDYYSDAVLDSGAERQPDRGSEILAPTLQWGPFVTGTTSHVKVISSTLNIKKWCDAQTY